MKSQIVKARAVNVNQCHTRQNRGLFSHALQSMLELQLPLFCAV